MKAFTYQMVFFAVLGPLTPFLMLLTEGNFKLADNMSFTLASALKMQFFIQSIIWVFSVLSVLLIISRMGNKKNTLYDMHLTEGYDLFLFIFVLAQMIIRAATIAVNIATLSDGKYRLFHEEKLTKDQLASETMSMNLH